MAQRDAAQKTSAENRQHQRQVRIMGGDMFMLAPANRQALLRSPRRK